MSADDVARVVDRVAHQLIERAPPRGRVARTVADGGLSDLVLVGIPTRGAPLARRLAARIEAFSGTAVDVGTVDITLYRDDLRLRGVRALEDTRLPTPTSTAARSFWSTTSSSPAARSARRSTPCSTSAGPARVQLAVLVDRGHRELPIRADYVGKNVPTVGDQAGQGARSPRSTARDEVPV